MQVLLDAMCGGLRPYLRMCGHDTVYAGDRVVEDDDRMFALAASPGKTGRSRWCVCTRHRSRDNSVSWPRRASTRRSARRRGVAGLTSSND